jgi:hypothetical protein
MPRASRIREGSRARASSCCEFTTPILPWEEALLREQFLGIFRDFLWDALEEAGCTNADILNHCRQPGEHVRGCWVVDLVLGKS